MIKRKLFIGSSMEGNEIAKKVKENIEVKFKWLEVNIWDESNKVFELNSGTLDSLSNASRVFDYGVLVATNDDTTKSRGSKQKSPRDNVIFEMGLFLGSLGLSRAFLLVEKGGKILSDFNGVTIPMFDTKDEATIENAINLICDAIEKTKNSFNLKPVPSTALAIGYYDSFISKVGKKKIKDREDYKLEIVIPRNLNNIASEIDLYSMEHPSNEISIYEEGSRPVVFEYTENQNNFWDIPTTLNTLEKSIDLFLSPKEIGENHKKSEWTDREKINFGDTLIYLSEQNAYTKNKISIKYLN